MNTNQNNNLNSDLKSNPINTNCKIGIIGGQGVMGKWLANFFKTYGYSVEISDLNTKLSNFKIAENCKIIILSTPIDQAIKISKQIGKNLRSDQVLMDICSQKEDILSAMLEYSNSEVVGTHPMFGPSIASVKNQNIVLCRGRGDNGFLWLKDLFSKAGANVTILNAAEHDKNMAIVQSLTHFISICFAKTLQKMGIHPKDIFNTSTPVFKINSDIIGRLFAQDPDLYATLIGSNKYADQCINLFSESFKETKENLIAGTHDTATKYIAETGDFLGNYKKEAMDRSNKFLNVIFE
ncbi:MAG: prephenate dehydrogenase/arogenate dehydrogenase family protein [Desulfobacteraceae bacterium]|nr:prephenate dehydrogenase/arogenate dehydrogenase family protein [Desulfobacteraceae bacterium]